LRYLPVKPLELAHQVQETIAQLSRVHFDIAPPAYHSAAEVAERLEGAVKEHFGDQAPSIDLVDQLSANALATSKAIRIRRDARFTDRDYIQLLRHQGHIHVAASINGKAQVDLPILADGHPGTTRTQEGLAVYAELISGSIELDRLRRLADPVVAIQTAIEGADFIEVYRYFLEQTDQPGQSFVTDPGRDMRYLGLDRPGSGHVRRRIRPCRCLDSPRSLRRCRSPSAAHGLPILCLDVLDTLRGELRAFGSIHSSCSMTFRPGQDPRRYCFGCCWPARRHRCRRPLSPFRPPIRETPRSPGHGRVPSFGRRFPSPARRGPRPPKPLFE
jgi:hypothetical protein